MEQGHRVKDIAAALNVTPAAVTQYLRGKRGTKYAEVHNVQPVISSLADKVGQRIRAGTGPLDMVELLDAAYQIMVASTSQKVLKRETWEPRKEGWLEILRQRLQLELKASQKCLELTNQLRDDYSKLLLRMVAYDSIRHADVIFQVISWLETGHMTPFEPPGVEFLNAMLEIEDRASELSLSRTIKIPHPVAELLLESSDLDEEKHEHIVGKMIQLLQQAVQRAPKVSSHHSDV